MRLRPDWPTARSRQRMRELEPLFARVPQRALGHALEIGGGDAFVAQLIAPLTKHLVTTDMSKSRIAGAKSGVFRLACDGAYLPFAGAAFDFIFSSSVLEHVHDRPAALSELRRCLKPGGIMLHIMPSQTWKLLQLGLYYPNAVAEGIDYVLGKITPARDEDADLSPETERARISPTLATLLSGLLPTVHGEYPGHVAEYLAFSARRWHELFSAHGFTVHYMHRLPLYSGYGFGWETARRQGARVGLSSHNAFIVSHSGVRPSAAEWFQ